MKISASFLSKEEKPKDLIKKINQTDADYLHVDVMDGKFVKQKTWTTEEIKKIITENKKLLDVHLMVKNPIKYINEYSLLNVEFITFHYESVFNRNEIINYIKTRGIKVGMSINPETNVSNILPFLNNLDLILIMSVNPGEPGQTFKESVLYKVETLRKTIDQNNLKTLIEIDGGVNSENIESIKEKGADIVVSASYIQDGNMQEKINSLR